MANNAPGHVPELRTEVTFLFDLVRQLLQGRVRIPRFQRAFVWRAQQMTDLLDSIWRQYPIGSLLAWESDSTVGSLSHIGPVRLTEPQREMSSFLLDGHQRLSTVAGALVSVESRVKTENDALWNIFFNARTDSFEHLALDQQPEAHQFPTSKILDTLEFLTECQRVLEQNPVEAAAFIQKFQDLSRIFSTYKVPVIHIEETGATEAVEIFARLNSKGQAMTADQMVSALLYREGDSQSSDLSDEISNIKGLLQRRGFGDLNRDHVLRIFLGAAGEDIYRTDWSRIAVSRRSELLERIRKVVPGVTEAVESALEFLIGDIGVRVQRLLPYAQQIVVLSTFFFSTPQPSIAQLNLLRRWFWVTSFTEWFGSANPSRVNAVVRDFMDNVSTERESPVLTAMSLDTPATPIPESFDMRSARAKANLLVMLSLKPLDRTGQRIDQPDLVIERLGPGAVTYIVWNQKGLPHGSSPANRIVVDDVSDRKQAKSWLVEVDGEVGERIWQSHGLTTEAVDALKEGRTSDFLVGRLRRMAEVEHHFLLERDVVPVDVRSSRRPVSNLLVLDDASGASFEDEF